jgi:menaquinone-dependent protoporphyrinogen oxidase
MERVLVAYATKRGSTREVAESVAETLRTTGLDVDVHPAGRERDLSAYDGVVVGGSLYMGRWHRDARRFLARHRRTLANVPVAVFAIGPLRLEQDELAESRRQLDRALADMPGVSPVSVAVFGGVVDPAKLRFPFNRMPASDARDWDAIRAWAEHVSERLRERTPADVMR